MDVSDKNLTGSVKQTDVEDSEATLMLRKVNDLQEAAASTNQQIQTKDSEIRILK